MRDYVRDNGSTTPLSTLILNGQRSPSLLTASKNRSSTVSDRLNILYTSWTHRYNREWRASSELKNGAHPSAIMNWAMGPGTDTLSETRIPHLKALFCGSSRAKHSLTLLLYTLNPRDLKYPVMYTCLLVAPCSRNLTKGFFVIGVNIRTAVSEFLKQTHRLIENNNMLLHNLWEIWSVLCRNEPTGTLEGQTPTHRSGALCHLHKLLFP